MSHPHSAEELDFVEELQLRRWARENYAPPEERDGALHPIVLEEMHAKDVEAEERSRNRNIGSAYVPLAPTAFHTWHPNHIDHADPNLLRETERFEMYIHG